VSAASGKRRPIHDALYGPVELTAELHALLRTPTLQRLRHVRLSNIDSVDMPSIANLSRLEHVIGVAHLSGQVGFRSKMSAYERLAFSAAALLHDWAISSYGHLVEEALQYVGTRFDHEERLTEIMTRADVEEVGGVDMQILVGRQSGLRSWAQRTVGERSDELLRSVMETIRGKGRWGRIIAGDIDLDNIDNVFRMAYHLGLEVDREIPLRLARSIVGVMQDESGPVFMASAEPDIQAWRDCRREVYGFLMLAEGDFVGKVMLLSCAVGAYEAGELTQTDWSLVDHQLIARLLDSKIREVKDAAERWIAGEPWDCTPLYWMEHDRPDYPSLRKFSQDVSVELGRPCFAYAIKDKRERRLTINFDDGSQRIYGDDAKRWLFGIGSSKKEPFSRVQVDQALKLAERQFSTNRISLAATVSSKKDKRTEEGQACLL
jgi:HD superfamily phosphohydrolase